MFKNLSFILLINIFTIVLYAQHSQGGGGANKMRPLCEIKGSVIDSTTSIPIEYASISVLDHDGDVITGGVTDKDGFFRIREINPGHYDIKIEFMGFIPSVIEEIDLSMRGNKILDLGKVSLVSKFIQIDAVNVIEERSI